jgi:F-type H+-transporting ATPase subunit delta
MAELAVVRRYARALFDTAHTSGSVEQVEQDLKTVDETLRTVPQLDTVLKAPTVSVARKKTLLDYTFGGKVSPLTMRFLQLVIERRREGVLRDIYADFLRLANELRNILPVQVTAATPLTDQERVDLAAALTRRTGKQVVLQVSTDPALMGGVVLRLGDTIIDGSIRTRLAQLRSQLTTGRIGSI